MNTLRRNSARRLVRVHRRVPMYAAVASILLALLVYAPADASPHQARQQQSDESQREYRIKSAFLYHFLHYGEWARDASSPASELVVCVAGEIPHVAARETLSDKRLGDRRVVVQPLSISEDVSSCRIAYFGQGSGPVSAEVLERLQDAGVLTVGETTGFTEKGGMIRLYRNRNRIRFEINLDAVTSAGIQMSSRVLQLATIV